MEVALLTIWHEKNFGAELQTYATVKLIQDLGHNVKVIDIRLSDCSHLNLKGKIGNFICSLGPNDKKFKKFWKKYIPKTKRYRSIKQLEINPPVADIYIVGSDQVWNPAITKEFYTAFFLKFGSNNISKNSFASSFGSDKWNYPQYTDEIKTILSNFNIISCRENSGINILRDTFNVKCAKHVIDPTLLLSNYSELIGNNIHKKNTLVYYPLSEDPELEQYSNKLGKILNLDVININSCSYVFNGIIWDRTDITDWVRNIAEAKFILTRSFHGVAFAIIHQCQFAAVKGYNNRNTRISDLLQNLGIEDRYYDSFQEITENKPWERQIDYNSVNIKLAELKQESIAVLHNIIENK